MKKNLTYMLVLPCLMIIACHDIHKSDECVDEDGDGYCAIIDGKGDDCDDDDPTIHPGAEEIPCDGIDQNCNGTDKACGCVDEDEDGFCVEDDCDDEDADVNPDALEICDDGVDNDCDDLVDLDDLEDCDGGCVDADRDGYCSEDTGGDDCEDLWASINPGAEELCGDHRDNDCDGEIDEGCGCTDCDGDGYDSVASGGDDCNDSNASVHPGATEICGDGVDNDCDGAIDEDCGCTDCDGDGYTVAAGDCNDANASIHPGASEICGDGVDNNCNGAVDEGCGPLTETNCSNGVDDDSDGFTDCADSDCYGLSGCPSPGTTACYRFTYVTPLSETASEISIQGSQCTPGHSCTHWLAPLIDSEGNRAEEFSSSRLQKTLKFIDGSSFEINVMYRIYGTEYWHCSYGGSSTPPSSGDPLFGTLTIEHTTATDCGGGWSVMATDWVDLGSGSSDCNVITL